MRGFTSSRISKLATPAALVALLAFATSSGGQDPPAAPPEGPKAAKKDEAKAKPSSMPKALKARAKPVDAGPLVMSSEAYARARGKSTDPDRYDGQVDWSRVPPWRQASFFGIKAHGQLFIYVVDCSGSMIDEDRLDRAKSELRRSVNALQTPQRFKVIFYNDRPVPMPGELPKPADYPSKAQLSRWLPLVEPDGETDPRASISLALAFKPDAIFLLSDGEFPEGTVESVARLNPKKVPIHCVDLGGGAAGDGLRQIAGASGGQYVARGR